MGPLQQTQDNESASRTLRLSYFSNEFPHDDLHGLLRKLRQHGFNTRHPILAKFMDEATRALREEVKELPTELRSLVPAFESIISLADESELRKGPLNGSMDGVLLCLVQISAYIGYRESYPEDAYAAPDETLLGGLGIGLLASSAISLAPSLEDLPMSGAEAIRIAFRLGVRVSEVSQNLEPMDEEDDSPDSWAYVVHDIDPEEAQKELDERQAKDRTPETHKIFLSAFSRTSVTISGPPSRLKGLFRTSGVFRDRKSIQLPVYGGLCHAAHVYTERDAQDIVWAKSRQSLNSRFWHRIPVLSTSTGKPYSATKAPELLKQIVQELLTQKIIWDQVMAGVINRGKEVYATKLQIETFRSSLPIQELQTAYKENIVDSEISTHDLIPWIADESPKGAPRSSKQSKLAIVGMSCRMPGGATSTEKFWELLESGLDVSKKVPTDRFDVDTHADTDGKRLNCSHTPYGCFINEPGLFDAPFFNMSPREAEQTDPMQRLALVTAYEALERAGYVANRTAATHLTRIGTWYGQASDDYREVNTAQEISTYFIPGGCRAFGPGRINYFFKFSGPSFNCDTACSSSLATIQAACTALWNGEVDTVVAGGVNVLTNSDAFAGLSNGHFLTKTHNACKTWDDSADGYCRADGVGSMVIKRLEDAEADNDNVLGLILGAGTNHSAEAVSITHPHAGHQAYLYRQVLTRAGVDPMDINYVELHGTGTQAGDSEEVQSITNVFAPLTKKRSKKNPLHIGAVKANVGHGEAAAGVTAFLKVLLMLQKGAIPPHVGIKNTINTKLPDLDKRNVLIPYEKAEWSYTPEKKRLAVINNFSAAGGNTSVIVEEPPQREVPAADPRSSHTVALSAKSKVSLRGNVENMIAYLESNPDVRLTDLAYSTTARRYHHNHRLAFHVSDVKELQKRLNSSLSNVDSQKPIPPTGAPPVAFVFTGQGASYKSMSLELFNTESYFRSQILHLDSLAQRQGFPSFIPAIDGSYPKEHQHSPVVTQVALTSIEIALAKYWESLGIKPEVVMGHSLGEYAALCVAGVISAGDAVFLVGTRARLLEEKCQTGSHKMLAVKASIGQIEECVKDKVPYEIACINGPMETVLSGTAQEMEAVSEPLGDEGYRCMPLDVAFAFHSAQTDPILEEFEEIASSSVVFQEPQLPVISPLLGKVVYDDGTLNANYIKRATREAVNFVAALESAQEMATVDKNTIWIEIGPHPVCIGFVKATMPSANVTVPSMRRGEDNWTTIAQSLGALHTTGVQIGWNDFHKPFESQSRLLDLPTYAWNDKTYWIQYNGDWALTKGNNFYDAEKSPAKAQAALTMTSSIKSSTVHQIIEETIEKTSGRIVMQSDLMQPDFLAAAHGHNMNGCGVVTSSIHADIAYTLGQLLYNKLVPKSKKVDMNIANLEVTKGLVAKSDTKSPQLIQVSATVADINTGVVDLEWYNVADDGSINEPFATANVFYGDSREWLESWKPIKHLVEGRVEALEHMAEEGSANRFSHSMAYTLFANNLVDYADKYRGMQAVVMKEFEATAEVSLTTEKGGMWTVPPFFIDSVAHLAGFIMNVSDASDTANTFCVTPGWKTMRFARPLHAGGKYRSYVKMLPEEDDPSVYLGDVYVMEEGVVIGMVGGIKFRRYPRMLLSRFFSPPDSSAAKANAEAASAPSKSAPSTESKKVPTKTPAKESMSGPNAPPTPPETDSEPTQPSTPTEESQPASTPPTTAPSTTADPDSTTTKAMQIIASEAGMPFEDLEDDMYFANIGVDSLMSLVISEKFRQSLGIQVASSLFLEYPSIGALRAWLEEYYS